ncbi:MAG: hypothetical protein HY677_05010 [Chloroflexi bacterium]|nr:hypothetical protein [Chloroflexota bacterium]
MASGRRIPFQRKVIVDEPRTLYLIDQLRVSIPEDVKEAEQILRQRQIILEQAQHEADRIVKAAEDLAATKVQEHEITRQAQAKAERMVAEAQSKAQALVAEAQAQAGARRQEVDNYTLDILKRLESQIASFQSVVKRGIESFAGEGKAEEKEAR